MRVQMTTNVQRLLQIRATVLVVKAVLDAGHAPSLKMINLCAL